MNKKLNAVPKSPSIFDYEDVFGKRALNQRRISVKDEDVKNLVHTIFCYIHYFNSLAEDTRMIDSREISEWPILNEFKDFIMPNSVRYESGNRQFADVLVRNTEPIEGFKPNYTNYLDTLSRFRGIFKKDASDNRVMLDSLRVDRSFEEIRSIAGNAVKLNKVHYINDPFVPVPVNCMAVLTHDYYWNAEAIAVVSDYISKLFF
jgi:hypothetical protein